MNSWFTQIGGWATVLGVILLVCASCITAFTLISAKRVEREQEEQRKAREERAHEEYTRLLLGDTQPEYGDYGDTGYGDASDNAGYNDSATPENEHARPTYFDTLDEGVAGTPPSSTPNLSAQSYPAYPAEAPPTTPYPYGMSGPYSEPAPYADEPYTDTNYGNYSTPVQQSPYEPHGYANNPQSGSYSATSSTPYGTPEEYQDPRMNNSAFSGEYFPGYDKGAEPYADSPQYSRDYPQDYPSYNMSQQTPAQNVSPMPTRQAPRFDTGQSVRYRYGTPQQTQPGQPRQSGQSIRGSQPGQPPYTGRSAPPQRPQSMLRPQQISPSQPTQRPQTLRPQPTSQPQPPRCPGQGYPTQNPYGRQDGWDAGEPYRS